MINKDYIKLLKQICLLNPVRLMSFLEDFLSHYYKNVIKKEGAYLIAEGDIPIALCAHLDTVAAAPPTHIYYDEEQNVMWSPELLGADDRAGVFAIIMIILHGFKPTIIFTESSIPEDNPPCDASMIFAMIYPLLLHCLSGIDTVCFLENPALLKNG